MPSLHRFASTLALACALGPGSALGQGAADLATSNLALSARLTSSRAQAAGPRSVRPAGSLMRRSGSKAMWRDPVLE